MEKSPSIINLAKALQQFHAGMGKITKDGTNPFFNSKYATLSVILEAIKQPLQDAGLSFTQFPTGTNGLTSVLMHGESGEYMQTDYFMQPLKSDPQAQGSVISYMRRYALAAILGLNLDEDDDANRATHGASTPKQAAQQAKQFTEQDKQWLDMNTPAYEEVLQNLQNGTITMKDVYDQFKVSKNVRAELDEAIKNKGVTPEQKAAQAQTLAEKPWLDKNSKKYDLVCERLRNKTTTLSQLSQFFKLNKEVRAELQSIVNESAGQP